MTSKQIIKNNDKNNVGAMKVRPQNKNLKPIKPGETRNPNGRPKGKLNYDTRIDMAIEVLTKKYVEDMNNKNKGKKGYVALTLDDVDIEGDIFAQHLNKARNGDRYFVDSFLDRRHGKAKQQLELSGSINGTIEHELKIKEAVSNMRKFQDKWFKRKK